MLTADLGYVGFLMLSHHKTHYTDVPLVQHQVGMCVFHIDRVVTDSVLRGRCLYSARETTMTF